MTEEIKQEFKQINDLEEYDEVTYPESMTSPLMGGKSNHSAETRARCVLLATVYGNVRRAAREVNVPYRTAAEWSHTDWWAEIEQKLKANASKSLEAKFTNIIRRSLDALDERLTNGDVKVLGNGTEVRVPVSAKDAAIINGVMFDKRALLRGDPTSRTERTSTAKDRLKSMAKEMESVAATVIKPKEDAVKH